MVNIYESGKLPLASVQIDNVAKHFHVSFPNDYRDFMLQYNGGVVSQPRAFKCADGQERDIAWFYDIDQSSESDICRMNAMRTGRLPKNFVAIGCDNSSNEICMNCNAGAGLGGIYFWDFNFEADRESGETPEQAGNYSLVADSFTNFLACLYTPAPREETDDMQEVTIISTPEKDAFFNELMKRKGIPTE